MKVVSYVNLKIKYLYLTLLILLGLEIALFAQDNQIGGVINLYKQVTAIDPLPTGNRVRLNDVSGLASGDTILLMQMKGGLMLDNPFGSLYSGGGAYDPYFGTPGAHEFLIIASIAPPYVTFTRSIRNNYDADRGAVQLIKVPYYRSAIVASTLTCQPWDSISKTGGALVFVVGSTLTLNANIDVIGKGFKGGESVAGNGTYASVSGNNELYYSNTSNTAGGKGEGVANYVYANSGGALLSILPNYARGKGAIFTGGGGGNGRYAGGGGGAGWVAGGRGGNQAQDSEPGNGIGGFAIKNTDIHRDFVNSNNMFMGGGGGGSTYNNGAGVSFSGANGGGIIIIICDTLKGNGNIITADGGSIEAVASGEAGTGGGGGGGSIAIYAKSYASGQSGNITLSARGGKGGSTTNLFGEGGGGGGGLIVTNSNTPLTVSKLVSGGEIGSVGMGVPAANPGSEGDIYDTYDPPLNGFLYNNIISKITGNKIDYTCSNISFGTIAGTMPTDGSIQWQRSSNGTTFTNITGASDIEYSPGMLSQTTWFRRVVTATVTDISEPVQIIVHQSIKDNVIGDPNTLCYGQNSETLISKGTLLGGNGVYNFNWTLSYDNNVFVDPTNAHTAENYTPAPALTATTWFRRTVTSGRCVDVSAPVEITVLSLISDNNILSKDQDICYGTSFENLIATNPPVLGGGNFDYRYQWISSINGSTWTPASGTNNESSYDPIELTQELPMNEYLYKRIVSSGPNDICIDTSAIVTLRDFARVTANAGIDTVFYSFDRYYQMQANPLHLHETGEWHVISGSGSFDSNKNDAKVINLSSGLNTFQWTVINGACINSAIVNLTVMDIFIPNGFSPNNDGINDDFEILGLDLINQYAELSIVNSAGTEIFYTSNKKGQAWNNWNGKTSNGIDLAESVYYYNLTLESKNINIKPYTARGFIVLKRK